MVEIILVLTIYMSDENKPIPAVEEEKDLGVTFNQKMKFSNHVDGICAAANRKLGVHQAYIFDHGQDGLHASIQVSCKNKFGILLYRLTVQDYSVASSLQERLHKN